MRNLAFIAVFIMLAQATFAQSENVLFSVGDENVTVSEFEYIYEKNNSIHKDEKLYSKKSLEEYLDLYIKFKLKVLEARAQGLDTTEKFVQEYNMYRNQLAQPYLTDKKVTEKLTREAYDRMQWVLRASHILIDVDQDAFPSDTLEAYNIAMAAKKKVLSGQKFADVARAYAKYTKDPTVEKSGGDIGYFSVFNTVYPFESAAYSAKEGEVVGPIRTQFGYHIIKVTERKAYQGEMKASHIMMLTDENDVEKNTIAKARIDSIYQKLKAGADFSELAIKYSEHYATAQDGGLLPKSFNYLSSNYPRVFINAVYELENDGDFSKPFKSDYGWHIARRENLEPMGSYDQLKRMIEKKVERDSRSQLSRKAAIENIKKQNRIEIIEEALAVFKKDIDNPTNSKEDLKNRPNKPAIETMEKGPNPEVDVKNSKSSRSILDGTWAPNPAYQYTDKMLVINKEIFLQSDFAEYLIKMQMPNKFSNASYAFEYYFNRYVEEMILDYENRHLEEKYPEFRNIAKEYNEGILLFEISDQNIWSKAVKDSIGLRNFYNENIDSFMWKKRADAIIFYCNNKATAKTIKKNLERDNSNIDELFKELNGANSMSFSYSNDVFEEGDKEVLDAVKWKKRGFRKIEDYDGRYVLIKFMKVTKPEPKKLKKIRGIVIADYQDYLEEKWVKELRAKYPVNINQEALNALYK